MSIRHICSMLLLAFVSSMAAATPVVTHSNVALVSDVNGGRSAGISRTLEQAGLFTDIYVITGASGFALLDGILNTVGGPASVNIDFYSATINNVAFSFSKHGQRSGNNFYRNFRETGVFGETGLDSPFTLTIDGRAGEGLDDGAPINATYFGTVNVNTVPEPASMALLLVSLFGVGITTYRRLARSTWKLPRSS